MISIDMTRALENEVTYTTEAALPLSERPDDDPASAAPGMPTL